MDYPFTNTKLIQYNSGKRYIKFYNIIRIAYICFKYILDVTVFLSLVIVFVASFYEKLLSFSILIVDIDINVTKQLCFISSIYPYLLCFNIRFCRFTDNVFHLPIIFHYISNYLKPINFFMR